MPHFLKALTVVKAFTATSPLKRRYTHTHTHAGSHTFTSIHTLRQTDWVLKVSGFLSLIPPSLSSLSLASVWTCDVLFSSREQLWFCNTTVSSRTPPAGHQASADWVRSWLSLSADLQLCCHQSAFWFTLILNWNQLGKVLVTISSCWWSFQINILRRLFITPFVMDRICVTHCYSCALQ